MASSEVARWRSGEVAVQSCNFATPPPCHFSKEGMVQKPKMQLYKSNALVSFPRQARDKPDESSRACPEQRRRKESFPWPSRRIPRSEDSARNDNCKLFVKDNSRLMNHAQRSIL
jgi:hypothetical protein